MCRSLHGGGAERVMVLIANELARRGHEVHLVLLTGRGPYEREVSGRVRIVEMPRHDYLRATASFARWTITQRPDAVLSTLVAPNAIAVIAARIVPERRRPRVVVREANTLSVALRYRPRASRIAAGAVARVTYPLADAIVAVSEDAAIDLRRYLNLSPERVTAIANPLDIDSVEALARAPVDHPWLAEPRSVPVILAAGRLVAKKGFDVLLRAMQRLTIARDARLLILGEGPERPALEALLRRLALNGVTALVGFVDNPFAWFAKANLFVLSSYAEGMPNVLLQAMACGCPVVATDCPSGPREVLRGGLDGALVPPGDAEALARAMHATLERPPASSVLRQRAAHFSIGPIVDRYEDLLRGRPGWASP